MKKALLRYILAATEISFKVGYNQQEKKRLTISELRKEIFFSERNAYFPVVWESYKAGLYARDIGD